MADRSPPSGQSSNAKVLQASEALAGPAGPKVDIESRSVTSQSILAPDPFQLRDGIVDTEQITALRNRKKSKPIAQYHQHQNDLISYLLKPMEEHSEDARAVEEEARTTVKIAVYASLFSNLGLCVLQLYAAISSSSLSLLATGIDSVFDIGSNVLLFWLHRKAAKMDINKWPVGGSRLETIGNIVYGFLMGSVNLVVVVESTRVLIDQSDKDTNDFHLPSIIAVGAALVVKFILFLYTFSIRKHSSQVQMLWQDHRNDLWINTLGIAMAIGGAKIAWYLDPMGGILIALGVIVSWGRTVNSEFGLLAGKSAPHEFLQLLIYKAATFDEVIEKVDTVRAYHSGPEYFIEIDIVMNGDTPLWKAHDVSQALQDKLETLPDVGRAFVHVDYEYTHTPEHRKLIKL